MLRLIEYLGQVFLGLADVFGDHQRQIDFVNVPFGGFAEQTGGHGLAGAGRTVEQAAIAGPQLGGHAPVVHQRLAVLNPGGDFVDLPASAGMQHQVVPLQLSLDKAGGKLGAELRAMGLTGGEPGQIFLRQPQRRFQQRFILAAGLEAENIVFGEAMVAVEQRLQGKTDFQIVGRQDKHQGLTGRQEVAVGTVADAAELGKATVELLIFSEEHIQQLRPQMRRQGEHHGGPFGERQFVMANKAGIVRIRPAQVGWRNRKHIPIRRFLPEIELEAGIQHLGEPGQFLFQVAGIGLNPGLHHHSTRSGAAIQGNLTQSTLQGKRSSTIS